MVYAIYENFMEDLEKKLKRVFKKCQKYGNPFTYEIVGSEIRSIPTDERDPRTGKRIEKNFKFILIDVKGTAKINDWECIAVLEPNEAGNIIRRINYVMEIPERFKTSKAICEHCSTKRNRKNLYIIHNTVTDEWKQVGGSCLMLYTNGLNAEYVAWYIDGITALEEYGCYRSGTGIRHYYNVDDVIARASEIIDVTGYFNSECDCPTKRLVHYAMIERHTQDSIFDINKELNAYKINTFFFKEDLLKKDTDEKVKAIKEYYLGLEDESEFIHNVQVMIKEGYVLPKNIGYLCYLPEGYAKHIQRETARAKRLEVGNGHYGEIGKRYKNIPIQSIDLVTSWYTDFGTTYLYKILIKIGDELRTLIWKSSKYIYGYDRDSDNKEFEKITFTVKKHDEYKGFKQTEVSRCVIA